MKKTARVSKEKTNRFLLIPRLRRSHEEVQKKTVDSAVLSGAVNSFGRQEQRCLSLSNAWTNTCCELNVNARYERRVQAVTHGGTKEEERRVCR